VGLSLFILFCLGLASILGSYLIENENKINVQVFNIGSIGTSSVSRLFGAHQYSISNYEINSKYLVNWKNIL
jgi:hypothetical protein